ncbi:hypothetical protein [Solibacillus ferritrahens]|uniref:hypothetical protein n=1 Tax=Solibacillus ferritrahens TaxID=3098620 RepID=UPI003008D89E
MKNRRKAYLPKNCPQKILICIFKIIFVKVERILLDLFCYMQISIGSRLARQNGKAGEEEALLTSKEKYQVINGTIRLSTEKFDDSEC